MRTILTVLVIFIITVKALIAQPIKADFLSLGVNGGTANYTGLATSQGFGAHLSADLNINSRLFANVTGTYNLYNTQANTFVFNFGIKAFAYRFIYLHPYFGYARILAEPETVKRGSVGLGLGATVKTGKKRHLNFEACGEYLPYYLNGTYYLFGRVNFPIFMANEKDDGYYR